MAPWTAQELFARLRELGPFRIISVCGPSVFEAIEDLAPFGVRDGWLNAMCDRYHWHLNLDRLGWVTSKDEVHGRSGRRVLFLELREEFEADPFLLLYLHRAKGEEFGDAREQGFAELHAELSEGAALKGAS